MVFAPFADGKATGQYETFATGTGGPTDLRASGLAVGTGRVAVHQRGPEREDLEGGETASRRTEKGRKGERERSRRTGALASNPPSPFPVPAPFTALELPLHLRSSGSISTGRFAPGGGGSISR